MEYNKAAFKVGLTVIIAAFVLGFIIIWLGINPYNRGYTLRAKFDYVAGLLEGSRVQLMGVKIGEVSSIYTEGNAVIVEMEIKRGVKIPINSKYLIVMRGLVGDRIVEIIPPKIVNGYVNEGDTVIGKTPISLNLLIDESKDILTATKKIISDPNTQDNIKKIVSNLEKTTKKLNSMLAKFDNSMDNFTELAYESSLLLKTANNLVSSISPDVSSSIASTKNIAKNLENISKQLEETISNKDNLAQVEQIINNTDTVIKNIDAVVKDISEVANDIKEFTQDKEIKSNIKDITKNAKNLTDKILKPIDTNRENTQENKAYIGIKTELLGSVDINADKNFTTGLKGNFNLYGNLGFSATPYYKLGLDEIGDKNLVNFQLGTYPSKNAIIRFGLIRSKLGLGTEVGFGTEQMPTKLTGEIYDITSPHIRLGILQNIFNGYGLSLYWDSHVLEKSNQINIGIRWQSK